MCARNVIARWEVDLSTSFSISEDGTLTSIPDITIKEDENGLSISLSVDQKEIGGIKPLLEKKLSRHFKSKGENVSDSKISEGVDKFLEQASFSESKIENPSIKENISLDFNDIELLHIKIAYELACHHFGREYINDPVANLLRLALLQQSIGNDIKAQTSMDSDFFSNFIDDDHHWVIFMLCGCYVKAFGFNSFIQFAVEGSQFSSTEGVVYKFCYKTQTHNKSDLASLLRDRHA